MMMQEMVLKNRSYCRFQEDVRVSRETLIELVGLARLTAFILDNFPTSC